MPELPEVETVRRGLAPVMERTQITNVEARRPDLRFALPERFVDRLTGAVIETLDRRGKYLIAALSSGESLIMHLGMSGRFTTEKAPDAGRQAAQNRPGVFEIAQGGDPKHDHIVFHLSRVGARSKRAKVAHTVTYNDPRRFGFMDLVASQELEHCRHFSGMGPEPLGNQFSATALSGALSGRAAPIKTALLDQRVVAGLGNIYVCEALFRAGISPRRKAGSVAGKRAERLYPAIIAVLREAIEAGGSSLSDFAATDGALGYFQHRFDVYDRQGDACGVCGAPIKRIVQGGRSTFFCGRCQR